MRITPAVGSVTARIGPARVERSILLILIGFRWLALVAAALVVGTAGDGAAWPMLLLAGGAASWSALRGLRGEARRPSIGGAAAEVALLFVVAHLSGTSPAPPALLLLFLPPLLAVAAFSVASEARLGTCAVALLAAASAQAGAPATPLSLWVEALLRAGAVLSFGFLSTALIAWSRSLGRTGAIGDEESPSAEEDARSRAIDGLTNVDEIAMTVAASARRRLRTDVAWVLVPDGSGAGSDIWLSGDLPRDSLREAAAALHAEVARSETAVAFELDNALEKEVRNEAIRETGNGCEEGRPERDLRALGLRAALVVPLWLGDRIGGSIGVAGRASESAVLLDAGWLDGLARRSAGAFREARAREVGIERERHGADAARARAAEIARALGDLRSTAAESRAEIADLAGARDDWCDAERGRLESLGRRLDHLDELASDIAAAAGASIGADPIAPPTRESA